MLRTDPAAHFGSFSMAWPPSRRGSLRRRSVRISASTPFGLGFLLAIQPGIDLGGAGVHDCVMHTLLAVVALVIGTSWGSAET